jgi:RHS repeat-associated protein
LIDHIDYDSFGNVILETDAAAGDRYKFTSRELDAETGLYYYRARYYDATIGRFTSEDPLGFGAGDTNLYRYVVNSPLNFTDPTGETSTTERAATQQTTLPLILQKANCLVDSTIKDLAVGTLLGGPALGAVDVSFTIVSCGIFPTSIKMQATFLRLSGELALKLKQVASKGGEVVVELAGKRFTGTFVASARKVVPPPSTVRGIKAAGRFDDTVKSLDEARAAIQKAFPDAVELPPAVAGQPYPSPPPGVKKWFQLHPREPGVGNDLPHLKYADWTTGKKGTGGSWGHIFFQE